MKFDYYLPVNLHFGIGSTEELGKVTAAWGRKALVVTGRESTKKTGLLDRAGWLLQRQGVECVLFDQVTPNPLSTTAELGTVLALAEECDVVVAIGGGSIIDCAKAIAFMVKNRGDIFDYIYGRKSGTQALPLIALPTTCGTGSEGNCFAVLTDPKTKDKKSLRNMASVPKASIIDPELMVTMPKGTAASVMFDALCHNMEAYLSKNSQPLTRVQALEGVRLLSKNMREALEDRTNMEAWSNVCMGSILGGMCIGISGVALPHGMEHPASGLRDIVHGRGLAALAPVIYEDTWRGDLESFGTLAKIMGGNNADTFVPLLRKLLEDIDLSTTLKEEGIRKEDVDWMTDNCIKVSESAIKAHPVRFDRDQIRELYLKAL